MRYSKDELTVLVEACEAVLSKEGLSARISEASEIYRETARLWWPSPLDPELQMLWMRAGLIYGATLAADGAAGMEKILRDIELYVSDCRPVPHAKPLYALLLMNQAVAGCICGRPQLYPAKRAVELFGELKDQQLDCWEGRAHVVMAHYNLQVYPSQVDLRRRWARSAVKKLEPSSTLSVYAKFLAGEGDGMVNGHKAFFGPMDIFH